MILPHDDKNSCLIASRTMINKTRSFILNTTEIDSCSQRRYVLCQTKPVLDLSFKIGCFLNPPILDLPAMISNDLTYEICLSSCQTLMANIAVIITNKCYCLNADVPQIQHLINHQKHFASKDCGRPCPGMFDWVNLTGK